MILFYFNIFINKNILKNNLYQHIKHHLWLNDKSKSNFDSNPNQTINSEIC